LRSIPLSQRFEPSRSRFPKKRRRTEEGQITQENIQIKAKIEAMAADEKNSHVSLFNSEKTTLFPLPLETDGKKGMINRQARETASNTTKRNKTPVKKRARYDCRLCLKEKISLQPPLTTLHDALFVQQDK
jgi:hypothetical protein